LALLLQQFQLGLAPLLLLLEQPQGLGVLLHLIFISTRAHDRIEYTGHHVFLPELDTLSLPLPLRHVHTTIIARGSTGSTHAIAVDNEQILRPEHYPMALYSRRRRLSRTHADLP
jgi:hypothetical protein